MDSEIKVVKGDITEMEVDGIVNAANSGLRGGGGVDGAIHSAGGKEIMKECKEIIEDIGELETGKAVHTTAGKLPAKYVIHTVGPVYSKSESRQHQLEKCYKNSLDLAKELNCHSIAFPNISTGIYGYPKKEAAEISYTTCKRWLENSNYKMKIHLVCFDDENYDLMQEVMKG